MQKNSHIHKYDHAYTTSHIQIYLKGGQPFNSIKNSIKVHTFTYTHSKHMKKKVQKLKAGCESKRTTIQIPR